MCGICGAVALDGRRGFDPELAERMNGTLVHRGPDSSGRFIEGPVCLAMRRLSIIDIETGDQPIGNEDGSIRVVQNGEIYNYRELRSELRQRGHRFTTNSDTEVMVHLYEEEGPSFVERLRGMFALALWDSRVERLVIARDRFGIKPLYYREGPDFLAFASELKALLADPDFPREVDLGALNAYLTFNWIPAPATIFRAARKLAPGHILVREAGRTVISEYARSRPVPADAVRTESDEELAAELLDLLCDSVRAHLVADVPVGVLLSGGIDSCALAALAAGESSEPLKTFSIGFRERAYSELDRARLVAERYGTEHHELIVEPDAAEILSKLAISFDEPFADSSALPTYLVSELAGEHVKVAFSGEGGDELFGGYNTYVADLLAPRFGRAASIALPLLERLPSSEGSLRIDDKLKRFGRAATMPELERHLAWTEVFSAETRRELLGSSANSLPDPLAECRRVYADTAGAESLSRLQAVDLAVLMAGDQLAKTDRASMAHSLEVRVPFLDQAVADFALALPARLKVRGFAKKRLLRHATEQLLPTEILRARKRGFSIPAAAWFRGELQPLLRDVLSPRRVAEQGFLEPSAVSSLVERHVSGREDLSRQLWGLMTFSLWHDAYLTPQPAPVH